MQTPDISANDRNLIEERATRFSHGVDRLVSLPGHADVLKSLDDVLTAFFTLPEAEAIQALQSLVAKRYERSLLYVLTGLAVRRFPQSGKAWYLRGHVYLEENQGSAEALIALENAWRLDRSAYNVLPTNLAAIYIIRGRLADAEAVCRWMLEQHPDDAGALGRLSWIMRTQGRTHDELVFAERAYAADPADSNAHIELWWALIDNGRLVDARECASRAREQFPGNVNVNVMLGESEARLDDWQRAWTLMQWKYRPEHSFGEQLRRHPLPQRHYKWPQEIERIPMWQGESLQGKTLCVWFDHGYGDTILLARLLPLVARHVRDAGGQLVVMTYGPLRELVRPLIEPLGRLGGELIEPADYHLSLANAAAVWRLGNDRLPGAAYMHADPTRVAAWRKRLAEHGGKRHVALVWSGGANHMRDNFRSIRPTELAPVLSLPDIVFHSINPASKDAAMQLQAAGYKVVDWSVELTGFGETAAIITAVDLTISVDSSPAHLGGALGVPTVMMLDCVGSYLWGTSDTRTPWYDSVRIFRQRELGQWGEVVERVRGYVEGMNV